MRLPIILTDPWGLYRGDSAIVGPFSFFDRPTAWAPATAYVAGVVGSPTYLANSTVTYLGVSYTCTTAHTSGATFDAADWTADPPALGPPTDLTTLGTVLTSQVRQSPGKPVLLALDTSASNLAGGIVALSVAPADWDVLASKVSAGFDVQLSSADGTAVTTLVRGALQIMPDFTYTSYGD